MLLSLPKLPVTRTFKFSQYHLSLWNEDGPKFYKTMWSSRSLSSFFFPFFFVKITSDTRCTEPPLPLGFSFVRTVESERDSGKVLERFKMADISAVNRRLLEISICALLREQGFSSASKIALETLTEMLQSCKQSVLSLPWFGYWFRVEDTHKCVLFCHIWSILLT